ncbi:HpcH/HpaI aldolase/citrate lyase family protein [Halorubrum sp. SD626R]|uniref:HpcH/HpaI aldolase family protein n=1 Tax=Halorubrum sp. SD626R TaxID=1419722 RepID=UPI000B21A5D5|nr:aldolase/citrate lyase family protein [Halorubrum sp. SD626R]TKX81878.1 aldolase [Halorubrum sp. SD626R]
MANTTFRTRLLNGETVVGTFQLLDSAMVSEMIGVAGMDFVVYDQEHGPLGAETTLELAAAAQNRGVAPIVRVRSNEEAEIQRALDIGSAGVQVPQVETEADARAAVDAARFDPLGSRGLSQYVRAGDYWGSDTYTEDQNEDVVLVVQVEGERGVENIEDILAIDGIDAVFLGPYDLSQSLGIPGQVTHERVEALMEDVCERAAEAGVAVGAFADTPEIANRWIDAGVQYVTLGVEAGLFTEHLSSLAADVDTT